MVEEELSTTSVHPYLSRCQSNSVTAADSTDDDVLNRVIDLKVASLTEVHAGEGISVKEEHVHDCLFLCIKTLLQ